MQVINVNLYLNNYNFTHVRGRHLPRRLLFGNTGKQNIEK